MSNFTPELIAKQYSEVLQEAVGGEVKVSRGVNVGQVRKKVLPVQKKV